MNRIRTHLSAIAWIDAVHAAAISAAPVILAVILGEPKLGWTSIAAFWACFGDPGGALRYRITAMFSLGLIGALFCFLASATAGTLWLLIPLTFLCCAAASLIRVWGPGSAIVGTLLSAGFVVAVELPASSTLDRLAYAGYFIAGALWAIVMTTLVWRRRPWKDATQTLAGCFRQLETYADALRALYAEQAADPNRPEAWSGTSQRYRGPLRAHIELTRKRIDEIMSLRPSRSARGLQLLTLLKQAEDAFLTLVAIADLMESHALQWQGREAGAVIAQMLAQFGAIAQAIANIDDVSNKQALAHLQDLHHELRRTGTRLQSRAQAYGWNVSAILSPLENLIRVGRLAIDATFGGPSGSADASIAPTLLFPLLRARYATLRHHFNLRSDAMRHALRVGLGCALAVGLTRGLGINHGFWMSLTLVFVIQPYFSLTWRRSAERILGTVAGAVCASLLGVVLVSPMWVALATLPIALGTFAGRAIHYALFTFFLTSQFILVAHIQQPGLDEWHLAWLRVINSVMGGVLAVVIGALLWPEREPQRLSEALRDAVRIHANYVRALLDPAGHAANVVHSLRRQACLAADNASATLQRSLDHPLYRRAPSSEAAPLLVSLKRITAVGTVLELELSQANAQDTLAMYGDRLSDWMHHAVDTAGMTESPESVETAPAEPAALEQLPVTLTQPLRRLAGQALIAGQLSHHLADH